MNIDRNETTEQSLGYYFQVIRTVYIRVIAILMRGNQLLCHLIFIVSDDCRMVIHLIHIFFVTIVFVGSVFREHSISFIGSYVARISLISQYSEDRAVRPNRAFLPRHYPCLCQSVGDFIHLNACKEQHIDGFYNGCLIFNDDHLSVIFVDTLGFGITKKIFGRSKIKSLFSTSIKAPFYT